MDPFILLNGSHFGIDTMFQLRIVSLFRFYGPPGILLFLFGSRTTWRIQALVLGRLKDDDALAFKRSACDDCTMVSVAAAIVAQIAITGLSLESLSQTQWFAKGSFVISLTFSLMAVYYSTSQARILGRLLQGRDVRRWIRGGGGSSLENESTARSVYGFRMARNHLRTNDPEYLNIVPGDDPVDVLKHYFTPCVTSVITISAPQMLLSASLLMLLIGLGVYFGLAWTFNLDTQMGQNGSRNVFIVYICSLAVAELVYSISQLLQDGQAEQESWVIMQYIRAYINQEKSVAESVPFDARHKSGVVTQARINTETDTDDGLAHHAQSQLAESDPT